MRHADKVGGYWDAHKRIWIYNFPCVTCNTPQEVIVKSPEMVAYRDGAYIQEAMPSLTSTERELLLTGICGECWEKMFGEEEDEI